MDIALALILHPTDRAVLIAQRKDDAHLGGLWEFPGGKCLPDEAPAAAAVRETREETGLDVQLLEAWPPIMHAYPERTVTLHPFLCRALMGEARPLGSRQTVWAPLDSLGRYAFPEANASLLARLGTLALHGTDVAHEEGALPCAPTRTGQQGDSA